MISLSNQEPVADVPTTFKLVTTLYGHGNSICRIAWITSGKTLASASTDGSVKVWDPLSARVKHTFQRHNGKVFALALSQDGRSLISGTDVGTLKCWDLEAEEEQFTLRQHDDSIYALAFTQDGKRIISASADHTIKLTSVGIGEEQYTFRGHGGDVNDIVISADDTSLISASDDGTLRVWDLKTGKTKRIFEGHNGPVFSAVVSPDGRDLFSASTDASIKVWDIQSGRLIRTLEGHTSKVIAIAISHCGRFLASKSMDNTVCLWDCDSWTILSTLIEEAHDWWQRGLAFHPNALILATLGENGSIARIWELDREELYRVSVELKAKQTRQGTVQAQYANAKIVLVGDSGVGKSGLSLVLTGQSFEPTDSTHGRRVLKFNEAKVVDKRSGIEETREVLLWDLAGQPGYRVFHRQHLDEVAVALVLFDSRSETDPFSGVEFWARALDEATRGFPLVKYLVAARIDRSGPAVSFGRIREVCQQFGFAEYYETSARRGDGIENLADAIHKFIPWDYLPRVNTPELFADMKTFIIRDKEQGRVVQQRSELLARYQAYRAEKVSSTSDVSFHHRLDHTEETFRICLSRIEAAGLIKRMSFGDLIVLQPELLDDYAAWLAQAARSEPDGLGYISERKARVGRFIMDDDRPLKGQKEEKLLITATIEDVVGRGIALRQGTEDGEMLVFPSELREDIPEYPGEYIREVAFRFQGPLKAIHSTLAVRLSHASAFSRPDAKPLFYRTAALFRSASNEFSGFSTDFPDQSNSTLGRITVFFDAGTAKSTKLTFLRYIDRHLEEMAYTGTVERERIFVCHCGYEFNKTAIAWCKERDSATIVCPLGHHTNFDDLVEKVGDWDEIVDRLRVESAESIERDERLTVLKDREQRKEYHVFLCHDSRDKVAIRQIATKLRDFGILPWLDELEIIAGDLFTPELEDIIERVPSVAVMFGPHWPTQQQQQEHEVILQGHLRKDKRKRKREYSWQQFEYYTFINRYLDPSNRRGQKQLKIIPVLIPGGPKKLKLPLFLRGFNWIDFRSVGLDDQSCYRKLVRAILDTEDGW